MLKGQDKKKTALFLFAAAFVVFLDQLSKSWVRVNSPQIELIPGFLDFISVPPNYGSAFGLLANQTSFLITVAIASIIIISLLFHYLSPVTLLSTVSIGLILGGAVGNLIDRLRFGCVTDFIDIHLGNLIHWYTFNIADSAIVVGIIIFIYSLYRSGLFSQVHEHGRGSEDRDA